MTAALAALRCSYSLSQNPGASLEFGKNFKTSYFPFICRLCPKFTQYKVAFDWVSFTPPPCVLANSLPPHPQSDTHPLRLTHTHLPACGHPKVLKHSARGDRCSGFSWSFILRWARTDRTVCRAGQNHASYGPQETLSGNKTGSLWLWLGSSSSSSFVST